MTGIAAVFERSGTVPQDQFDAVFDALAHRSWDGADSVSLDRIALGHQHAYTLPEEVGEQQPISIDDCWITFDGRIDNREEILQRIGSDERPSECSDAEITLRAYRALGVEFLEHLIGAFALSIWDPSSERLLIARDKTGIRKLYYAESDERVVVASEMQAILEHPGVSSEINECFVGESLTKRYLPQDETFHSNIKPVLPGSYVEVTPDETLTETYWKPWEVDLDLDDSDDFTEEFLDRLENAVACRLRSTELPGIMLSGGLDSTTIACMADRYLDRTGEGDADLHSFTMLIDGVDFFEDEIDRLNAVVEQCDLRSHRTHANDYFTLKDIDLYEREARESPVYSPLVLSASRLFEEASESGRTVLLGGFSGNLFDGNRFCYFDLLRERHFAEFIRQVRDDPVPLRRLLLWFVLVPASDHVTAIVERWYDDEIERDTPPWIGTDFAERCQLADRLAEKIETDIDSVSKELIFKHQYLTDRRFEDAVERRVALQSGVDLRSPFLDSRLIEFLFALPPGELLQGGESKALFRRALKGILPEKVRTQSASVHFDPVVDMGIRSEQRAFVEELLADSRLSELGIVDEDEFSALVRSYLDEKDGLGTRAFWGLISLELWLDQWS